MNVLNLRYSNELIKRNINGDVALYQDYWCVGEYCLVGCRKKWFFLRNASKIYEYRYTPPRIEKEYPNSHIHPKRWLLFAKLPKGYCLS